MISTSPTAHHTTARELEHVSHARPRLRYVMYGLLVESEIALPLREQSADPVGDLHDKQPDVVIERAEAWQPRPEPVGQVVARENCPTHGEEVVVTRGPLGAWIWNLKAGLVHVDAECRRIVVYADIDADERVLGLVLAGQVSVFVLHQLGCATLHASAVQTPFGAVAFLGPRGQGKSTMAAAFLQRGMPLLTDDVLPMREDDGTIRAIPSLPYMKLWPETVHGTFGLEEQLPEVVADLDKKLLRLDDRFAFASDPLPVRALYIVQRFDAPAGETADIVIEPLSAQRAVAMLLAQISFGAFLWPHERARLLAFYARLVRQAPVRMLTFPHGFEHQEAVCDRILTDVAELSAR